jgi:hypothetical protein
MTLSVLREIGVRIPHEETVSRLRQSPASRLDRGLEEILEAAGGGD